jgi:hypothetical protein
MLAVVGWYAMSVKAGCGCLILCNIRVQGGGQDLLLQAQALHYPRLCTATLNSIASSGQFKQHHSAVIAFLLHQDFTNITCDMCMLSWRCFCQPQPAPVVAYRSQGQWLCAPLRIRVVSALTNSLLACINADCVPWQLSHVCVGAAECDALVGWHYAAPRIHPPYNLKRQSAFATVLLHADSCQPHLAAPS